MASSDSETEEQQQGAVEEKPQQKKPEELSEDELSDDDDLEVRAATGCLSSWCAGLPACLVGSMHGRAGLALDASLPLLFSCCCFP